MHSLILICHPDYPERKVILINIQRAIEICGGKLEFSEISSTAPGLPSWATGHNLPAIFINQVELKNIPTPAYPEGCRIFQSPDGGSRVPSVGQLVSALNAVLRA